MRKRNITAATLVIAALAVGSASAAIISVEFNENPGNQIFVNGDLIGPLGTTSTNWNDTGAQDAAGTINNLIDDTGATTGASVTWSSANTWYNSDGTADEQHMLSVGYLDDGGAGLSITIANIPYAQYKVYGLYSTDAAGAADGAAITSGDFTVNGVYVYGGASAANPSAYGSIEDNNIANGEFWTENVPSVSIGNYWTFDETSGTVNILGFRNGAARGTLSGVIIEQIPEPATLGMLAVFGGGILFIRRRLKR